MFKEKRRKGIRGRCISQHRSLRPFAHRVRETSSNATGARPAGQALSAVGELLCSGAGARGSTDHFWGAMVFY